MTVSYLQLGDKKKTSLEYQCLNTGEFNLPINEFPGCAPKREYDFKSQNAKKNLKLVLTSIMLSPY